MNYEDYFIDIKNRVITDLGDSFDSERVRSLTLVLNYGPTNRGRSHDQYRGRSSRIPAFYNPNTHTVHLNVGVIGSAASNLVENIYYHELVHACSHHAKFNHEGKRILKSGIKIQMWDDDGEQAVLNRGLNEGLTQYFANMFTYGGSAYRREVEIIGKIVSRVGLSPLKSAYFSSNIDKLEEVTRATFGDGFLQRLSELVDAKQYDAADALL